MNKCEHLSETLVRGNTEIRVDVFYDEWAEDPRKWSNLGTMVCSHRRYNLGDEKVDDLEEWLCDMARSFDSDFEKYCDRLDNLNYPGAYGSREWLEHARKISRDKADRAMEIVEANAVILPLYLYDHGGITMSTNRFPCSWDSGLVGFIYADRKKILEEYSRKKLSPNLREKVADLLESEVKTYDQYIMGDVYYYEVQLVTEDEDGDESLHELDSCGGLFGSDDMCEHIKENEDTWFEQAAEKLEELGYNEAMEFAQATL